MRLLIISDMPHYQTRQGITGWGPTMTEINYLTHLFKDIVHIGCLYPGDPPPSCNVVKSPSVRFVPIEPSGGDSFNGKFDVIRHVPIYLKRIRQELKVTDAVFIRCPSNIGLIAMVYLSFIKKPIYRWAKYAGNWNPEGADDVSYRIQRWWLNHGFHRGAVTVNGRWPKQSKHIYSFINPSFFEENLDEAKSNFHDKHLSEPIKLLFVGRCETAKGVGRVIQITQKLFQRGIFISLNIVGDGEERHEFEKIAASLPCQSSIHFHGWLSQDRLKPLYQDSHFLLLPTTASEGWPKVLSEGMAYGVVPIAGAISSIPEILERCGTGLAISPFDEDAFVEAIIRYINTPEKWKQEVENGVKAAHLFTYENYLQGIREMFRLQWGYCF